MEPIMEWLVKYNSVIKSLAEILVSTVGITLSYIAIKHSRKAIELTEKSIYEANRPVVSVYLDYISVYSSVHEYLVIKNFGSTPAQITSIVFSEDMPITHKDKTEMFSDYGLPFLLAPNQSFSRSIRVNALSKNNVSEADIYHGKFTATVKYTDGIQEFEEIFVLNQDLVKNYAYTKSNGSPKTTSAKAILHATEELLRKNI